jgi:acetylornithine/succinyldiaminopimelate/putrescine aminotransferase
MSTALMPTYARYPLTLVRGEGLRVWDDDGASYLDLIGGLGALSLGHAHPRWLAAVTDAASTLGLTSNLVATPAQVRLGERLVDVTPLPDAQVFLCNSGAEANEALLKLVRKHGLPVGRPTVVALEGSFHGRTIAALAATGQPEKRAPFEPLVDWFRFVPPADLDALDAALAPGDVAAVLLEPILGEGGVVALPEDYLRGVRARCDAAGALFAVDEVQSGSGRTGSWLSITAAGVTPDVVSLAKALGGGLPIGALVAPAHLAFGPGEHASTFGGGPVPSAAAIAVLDTIRNDDLLANVGVMGALLRDEIERLAPADTLVEVRGRGLLIGCRVTQTIAAADVVTALRSRGVLASTAGGDVVRFTPPYTIGPAEVDEAVKALASSLAEVAP